MFNFYPFFCPVTHGSATANGGLVSSTNRVYYYPDKRGARRNQMQEAKKKASVVPRGCLPSSFRASAAVMGLHSYSCSSSLPLSCSFPTHPPSSNFAPISRAS
ncbi:hypothetical protein BHE74_00046648 [Ensete ventricosum]|nr:hypothetical protein BHE74_00046648 [Ensete ventricosum]